MRLKRPDGHNQTAWRRGAGFSAPVSAVSVACSGSPVGGLSSAGDLYLRDPPPVATELRSRYEPDPGLGLMDFRAIWIDMLAPIEPRFLKR